MDNPAGPLGSTSNNTFQPSSVLLPAKKIPDTHQVSAHIPHHIYLVLNILIKRFDIFLYALKMTLLVPSHTSGRPQTIVPSSLKQKTHCDNPTILPYLTWWALPLHTLPSKEDPLLLQEATECGT